MKRKASRLKKCSDLWPYWYCKVLSFEQLKKEKNYPSFAKLRRLRQTFHKSFLEKMSIFVMSVGQRKYSSALTQDLSPRASDFTVICRENWAKGFQSA